MGSAQRGRASGLLGVATLSGQVVGAVAAGLLAPRTTCVVIAAVVALTAAATVAGVTERVASPEPGAGTAPRRRLLVSLRGYLAEFAAYPDFCWVVLSRFLIFTSLAGIQRFAANYIRDTFHGRYNLFGLHLGSAQTTTFVMLAVVILCGLAVTGCV